MICKHCGFDGSNLPMWLNWWPHMTGSCRQVTVPIKAMSSDKPTERDSFIMGVIVGVLLTGFAWLVYAWTMAPGVCR